MSGGVGRGIRKDGSRFILNFVATSRNLLTVSYDEVCEHESFNGDDQASMDVTVTEHHLSACDEDHGHYSENKST